ncbi:hypothetical protein H5410_014055 [Solanum commersonii]|uniref:Peroxidase n=1 Tax=Solanum commersonii TaxID=4109 RepID=A0A9J5ZQB5_SOLCO|nr:hypothetical protein H5410_014055 [Solanum commersonii]
MAKIIWTLFLVAFICLSSKTKYYVYGCLDSQFYDLSCPKAKEIVKFVVSKAVAKEARMAASLLRLHFHDCFVKGCDASLLLDSSRTIVSEKSSNANRNSARGFEVIDEIKCALEKECPQIVSCADILALAARDSTVLAGGPSWEVPLGRRDSREASLSGSNNDIPAPNNTFDTIFTKFNSRGLDLVDLVALSGAHTIGDSRCISFKQRLYGQSGNYYFPDYSLDRFYGAQLSTMCPRLWWGLLNSDQVLVTQNMASLQLVTLYAQNNEIFFQQFAKSMLGRTIWSSKFVVVIVYFIDNWPELLLLLVGGVREVVAAGRSNSWFPKPLAASLGGLRLFHWLELLLAGPCWTEKEKERREEKRRGAKRREREGVGEGKRGERRAAAAPLLERKKDE